MIGKVILNYKIKSLIGSGGMADVYLAENVNFNRKSAIKHLLPNLNHNTEIVKRFRKELKIMAEIEHKNAVQVFNYEENSDGLFIVLEFVDGKDLSDKIAALNGPMPIEDARKIVIQVLEAFIEIHNKGIVHRDVKPSNILLTKNGRVKVTDFGISGIVGEGELEKTNVQSIGTVPYMAPEQIQNRSIDSRTDIYAIGVTLYEMLLGSSIYSGCTSPFEIQTKIVNEDLPSLVDSLGEEYESIWKVIEKATKKDKNARYRDANAMLNALTDRTEFEEAKQDTKTGFVEIEGCMDPKALNFNPRATVEGTCIYRKPIPWKTIIACLFLLTCIVIYFLWPDSFDRETLDDHVKKGEYQEALDYVNSFQDTEVSEDEIGRIEDLNELSKL